MQNVCCTIYSQFFFGFKIEYFSNGLVHPNQPTKTTQLSRWFTCQITTDKEEEEEAHFVRAATSEFLFASTTVFGAEY